MTWPEESHLRAILELPSLLGSVREDIDDYLGDPRFHHEYAEHDDDTDDEADENESPARESRRLCERLNASVLMHWGELLDKKLV